MQNDFEAKQLKHAKKVLLQDLTIAEHHLKNYKEIQKERIKKPSFWEKIKNILGNLF
jgi:hypothetical protein